MNISEVKGKIPKELYDSLERRSFTTFLPAQEAALKNGLLDDVNVLICTPTASGKTLIAEIAMLSSIYNNIGKAIYIAPLKALASEKFFQFKHLYPNLKVALTTGDLDEKTPYARNADIVFTTSEKLDSEIRHDVSFLQEVKVIVIDEIHLLHDASRGPTLEVLITILKRMKGMRIIGLSATIGNPQELAEWLNANLVFDTWRPVELKKALFFENKLEYFDTGKRLDLIQKPLNELKNTPISIAASKRSIEKEQSNQNDIKDKKSPTPSSKKENQITSPQRTLDF